MHKYRWEKPVLLLIIFILLFTGSVFADNYFVSVTGDDSFSGRIDDPFRTISMAATIATAGDSVFIRKGVYKERLNPKNSGEEGKYITFSNYENEKVVIDAKDLSQGVMLWRKSYIRIRGLIVINSTHSGIHIHHHLDENDNGSDYNIIENNTVRKCGSEGYSGIYSGGDYNIIKKNTVFKNGRITNSPKDHGIYILGSNNRVSDNSIIGNAMSGIRMEGENNVVERNIIENNGDFGLTVYVDAPLKGRNILISNNILLDNERGGISIYGNGSGEKPSDIYIYNNTIANTCTEFGVRSLQGSKNIKVINNIITGQYLKAIIKTDSESINGYEEDNNIFYGQGPYWYNGRSYNDFYVYSTVSSCSVNSIVDNPLLGPDFLPYANSPAVNNGKDIGLPFIGSAPDIGAKETLIVD